MSATICPNGHTSASPDYCDVCGAPVDGSPAASNPGSVDPAPLTDVDCPHCGTRNDAAALFCEACGYDFTTGTLPRPAAAETTSSGPDEVASGSVEGDSVAPSMPAQWVAEVWVDPDWYAAQESEDACPSPGVPLTVPLRLQSLLVGRPSTSRGIHPDVDLTGDPGVSRRHAQLTSDGSRWWVEDLQSANGTFVGSAGGPVPDTPLSPGQRREVAEGDRIYVGAWTRLVVRRATPEELSAPPQERTGPGRPA